MIGRQLIELLKSEHEIIALSRSSQPSGSGLNWRRCDLYSLLQAEEALAGADYAIYLVHSPIPLARLTQGSAEDMDLILADNFARAAHRAGVGHIVYVGNLLPAPALQSAYLRSRQEVEEVLRAYHIPLTVLRAPLVLGGAALEIARNLAQRLPLLLAPRWAQTPQQPIAPQDLARWVQSVLGQPEHFGQTYELAGSERLSYLELVQKTAERLVLRPRPVLRLKASWLGLSSFALQKLSGLSASLVNPMIESLLASPAETQAHHLSPPQSSLEQVLQQALAQPVGPKLKPRTHRLSDVRSVQRLPVPKGRDAYWLAECYTQWLPGLMKPLLHVRTDAERRIQIFHLGIPKAMLELSYSAERSTADRALFYITGGLLADSNPDLRSRMEFRIMPGGRFALVALHEFAPSLPWLLYCLSQALIHLWTMKLFVRHLNSLETQESPQI